ncbi:hypothetical protein ACVFVO_13970 [Advenella kashmirensis]
MDISTWKYPDEGALLDVPVKSRYFARKRAVTLYLKMATEQEINAETGMSIQEIIRLIKRCLLVHNDGEVWGWRALVPWLRINSYQRKYAITVDNYGFGTAGALNAVLNQQPDLRRKLEKRILTAGSMRTLSVTERNKQNHWRWFLGQLRTLGYEAEGKWPFNTKRLGYVSICSYVDKVLKENPEAAALVTGGPENKKKLLTGDGTGRPIQHLFERVEMDAHKIDGIFSISIAQPTGGYAQRIVHRLWIIVILEVVTRCVLGYHLSMRKEVSKFDVLRAIKTALTKWSMPSVTFSDRAYLPGAGLPSSSAEKFIGICWNETSVDGALAETCKHVKRILKDVVGSELIEPKSGFSARRSMDDRPFIEVFFKQLESKGFQKLSNTTGSKPAGRRGRNPERIAVTSQFQIEYVSELLAVLIANYNATPHSSLGGRSPLEYLEFRSKYPEHAFRYADPNSVIDIVSTRQLCKVHGGYEEGRRPFIYFAHGRYTSDTLRQRHDLVGQKIWIVTHMEDDVRIVRASTASGQHLGLLHVSAPWTKLPHSLEVRSAVAAYISAGKLQVAAGQDAIELFINFSEDQPDNKLPIHPAYIEIRRILAEIAEATLGRPTIDISKEQLSDRAIEDEKSHRNNKPGLPLQNKAEVQRNLPAPRKAANN